MRLRMTDTGIEWHCDFCDSWSARVFLVPHTHGRLACCLCLAEHPCEDLADQSRQARILARALVDESRRIREERETRRRG